MKKLIKKFQRTKEDFYCENCEKKVKGNGFTNHCPKCLFSKHVDVNPGDRENPCGGMMQPVNVFLKKGKWNLEHVCEKCGEKKVIKMRNEDSLKKAMETIEGNVKGEKKSRGKNKRSKK